MSMVRMSAEEFDNKPIDKKLWNIYDTMQDGHDTMKDLRVDVDKNTHIIEDVGKSLDGHINDKLAHPKVRTVKNNPGNPGNGKKIINKRNGIIITIISFGTALVLLATELIR